MATPAEETTPAASSCTDDSSTQLHKALTSVIKPHGLEVHPFLVGWYNELVKKKAGGNKYAITGATDDTLAFVVVSTPAAWRRFADACPDLEAPSDPFDSFTSQCIASAIKALPDSALPTGVTKSSIRVLSEGWDRVKFQPYVLVQTAGHCAGAARLYQEADVKDSSAVKALEAWKTKRRAQELPATVFPVAIHPKFGGWFAFRAVLVIQGVRCPDLPRPAPPSALPNDDAIVQALVKFGDGWLDRELAGAEVEDKYDAEAIEYFSYLTSRERKVEILASLGYKSGRGSPAAAVAAAAAVTAGGASRTSSGSGGASPLLKAAMKNVM